MNKAKESAYYEQPRPEMLAFLPEKITRSIEFGCSTGLFSKTVKEQKGSEAWGVDMDEQAIAIAAGRLDRALAGDVFDIICQLPENSFDCVICNDFLEHLAYPDKFLLNVKRILTPGGSLVCSLPNVRYWKNVRELLFEKDWRYRDAGILDNTHLRFFTKKSMIRLMVNNGYKVELIKGINPNNKSLRFIIPNLLTLGKHRDMQYLQFGIRATLT